MVWFIEWYGFQMVYGPEMFLMMYCSILATLIIILDKTENRPKKVSYYLFTRMGISWVLCSIIFGIVSLIKNGTGIG